MPKIKASIDQNSRKQAMWGNLTQLRKEEAQNMEAEKETAEVLETGQDNEAAGKKAVKELEKINQDIKKREDDDQLNKLDMRKKLNYSYKDELANALATYLKLLDWIPGWVADVVITDGSPINIHGKPFTTKDGILLVVTTKDKRVMHKGVMISRDPLLDYAAMQTLAVQMENTLDKERGILLDKQPENVIYGKDGLPYFSH
jgi:hypothetical protein